MKTIMATVATFFATAGATLASDGCAIYNNCPPVTNVPEISAMEGTAALVALAAIVLLTWERRRRAH